MKEEYLHIPDEQLLLHASGELSTSRSGQIQLHLEACSQCRNRLQELESTLAEFGEVHRNARDAALPPIDERRAQLRTRLAELAEQQRHDKLFGRLRTNVVEHGGAAAVAAIMIAAHASWLRSDCTGQRRLRSRLLRSQCRHRLGIGKNLICA